MTISGLPDSSTGEKTLIDELIAEQRDLSAVARFSQKHDRHDLPLLESHYRDLIPLSSPRPGQQYAFEVNLDQCSGCKACVTACHSLNGLDEDETFRNIGLLHGVSGGRALQQTVTTACHHCVDPACLNGCPVLAYEKDKVTGIVRHLDDQCIGCQYCVLQCPYDVPKYNTKKGVVRKCDMCSNRLAVGEAPACVQACPSEAIRISVVETASVREALARQGTDGGPNPFLPGSPNPAATLPTTRYLSRNPDLARMVPADQYDLQPAHAHWSLILMLPLSQLAVGALLVEITLSSLVDLAPEFHRWHALAALGLLGLSMAVGTFHLGRPLGAWRAFLGLRRSWLSREIIAFGALGGMAAIYAAILWAGPLGFTARFSDPTPLLKPVAASSVVMGLFAVFSSVMIYQDTRRAFWSLPISSTKFFGTLLLLGPWALLISGSVTGGLTAGLKEALLATVISVASAKLLTEFLWMGRWRTSEIRALRRSAKLLRTDLIQVSGARFLTGICGGILVPMAALILGPTPSTQPSGSPWIMGLLAVGAVLTLVGEILERYLFFTAVAPEKMPGGVGA